MRAGTNEWQRVDNTGCFPSVLRLLLLAWVIVLPYAFATGSRGWFLWSSACVIAGAWLTLRQRQQRGHEFSEMNVDVAPSDLYPDEQFVVSLNVGGEKAHTIRWWSAEMMAAVEEDDPKTLASGEFAIDSEAGLSPVSQLQMVLTVPGAKTLSETKAREWWVQVTVQTERGRMESGRVPVRVKV